MAAFPFSYFDARASEGGPHGDPDGDHHIATTYQGLHLPPKDVIGKGCAVTADGAAVWTMPAANEDLVVTEHAVYWYQSGVLRRKFGFPESSVRKALFTHFDLPVERDDAADSGGSAETGWTTARKRAIVILLADVAHMYLLDGAYYAINVPFAVRDVFATAGGLVFERDTDDNGLGLARDLLLAPDAADTQDTPDVPKFFTLVDPLTHFGVVAFAPGGGAHMAESLVYVSPDGGLPYVATIEAKDDGPVLHVYAARYLVSEAGAGRRPSAAHRGRSLSRRISSMLPTVDDAAGSGQIRTEIALTMDRLGGNLPDGLLPNQSYFVYETANMRQELALTSVESFPLETGDAPAADDLRLFMLAAADGRHALCVMDHAHASLLVLFFAPTTGDKPPRFADSLRVPVLSAVKVSAAALGGTGAEADSYVLILTQDRGLYLYDPFLRVLSPALAVDAAINMDRASRLLYPVDDTVTVFIDQTEPMHRIRVQLAPTNVYVGQAMAVVGRLLPAKERRLFAVSWMTALQAPGASTPAIVSDWDAFATAVLVWWIGPGVQAADVPAFAPPTDVWAQFLAADEAADNETGAHLLSREWCSTKRFASAPAAPWTLAPAISRAVALANFLHARDPSHKWPDMYRSLVAFALHLLSEEWRLDTFVPVLGAQRRLDTVVGQLVAWMGWSEDWVRRYSAVGAVYDVAPRYPTKELFSPPPNVYQVLHTMLTTDDAGRFPTLDDLTTDLAVGAPTGPEPMPLTRFVLKLVNVLCQSATQYEDIVTLTADALAEPGGAIKLDRLPPGVLVIINEAIVNCQENTPTSWGLKELSLVGRHDLQLLLQPDAGVAKAKTAPREPLRDMHALVEAVTADDVATDSVAGPWDRSFEHDRAELSQILFRDDRRLHDVQKMLQISAPQACSLARVADILGTTESEAATSTKAHLDLLKIVGARKLAVSVGRGAFLFAGRTPLVTERFPVPSFDFSVVLRPGQIRVRPETETSGAGSEPDSSKLFFAENNISWGKFHNGVACGLSIPPAAAATITANWIVYNRSQDLSPEHAGFLLGLGLNGHLRVLESWHIYNYLNPKHAMTSAALLVGMAASHLGTKDEMVSRVVSVHVNALLPSGSSDMNVEPVMQTAGILSVGLNFYGTAHRRMSSILMAEIEGPVFRGGRGVPGGSLFGNLTGTGIGVDGTDWHQERELRDEAVRDEGYILAAGFALGFVNVGRGYERSDDTFRQDRVKSGVLNDLRIVERLLAAGVGSHGASPGMASVVDKTAAGAIVALMLIFLKTGDASVARKVDMPETDILFSYVRPDLLLLRVLARQMILWSDIGRSVDWIYTNLRPFLQERYCGDRPAGDRGVLKDIRALDSDDLPIFNIVAGLCLAVGLRYAGTCNGEAKATLVYYLDEFVRLSNLSSTTHDQRISKAAIRTCQSVVALAASLVVAGTGDLEVLRRLRYLHAKLEPPVYASYGVQMATHMAIGFLFLGGGEYSLSTASRDGLTEIGLAGLLLALYPQFPNDVQDNKAHLQAFRHFWVYAVEKRYLVARDLNTLQPLVVPVEITVRRDDDTAPASADTMRAVEPAAPPATVVRAVAPCMLPPLDRVVSVKTLSEQHWTVQLDVLNNPLHARVLRNSRTIYMHRRTAAQANDMSLAFQRMLQAADEVDAADDPSRISAQNVLQIPLFQDLDQAEKALVLPADVFTHQLSLAATVVDLKAVLQQIVENPTTESQLWNVRLLFAFATWVRRRRLDAHGDGLRYVSDEFVERLKLGVWRMMALVRPQA
ncbi:uncharacterized protein V1510DRAFT_371520 [Dipodascopsis tothii]|uniref:uncharacterized protein n=1 Tax=Dipodascopsis tothii TaxID=44089 RepID=UPI0034CF176E